MHLKCIVSVRKVFSCKAENYNKQDAIKTLHGWISIEVLSSQPSNDSCSECNNSSSKCNNLGNAMNFSENIQFFKFLYGLERKFEQIMC